MFQTVLMFLAAPQNMSGSASRSGKFSQRMATATKPALAHSGVQSSGEYNATDRVSWLAVVGNALGFFVLIAGLWLVLRLAETLLV